MMSKKVRYNLDWIPYPIHRVIVKLLAGVAVNAMLRRKQTPITRAIRATWRAL